MYGDGTSGAACFGFRGVTQLVVKDNYFSLCTGFNYLGVNSGANIFPMSNLVFEGNTFVDCKAVHASDVNKSLISIVAAVVGGSFRKNNFIASGVFVPNASTASNMHTFGFEASSNASAYLTFTDNSFVTNGLAFTSTISPFYSAVTLTYASLMLLGNNTYIGIAPLQAIPSMYGQCRSEPVVFKREVTLTATEINNLRATPIALVPRQGTGVILEFVSAMLIYNYGAVFVLAGDYDLMIQINTAGFIDQTNDEVRIATATWAIDTDMTADNNNIELTNNGAAEISGGVGSTLKVIVNYRIHNTGL